MRCTACGKENGDAGRFCIHCGAPLSSRTDSSEGANLGTLEEDLRNIAFALGQLESLEAEGTTGPEAVEAMRRDLLAEQRATLEHLVRAAATLPLPRAESLLLGHLQLFPHDAIARLHLGLFYWQSSQVQRAAEQFLLASACDPSWPEPHLKLAQLSQESGNKAQALYEYGAYLQSEPEPRQRDDARSNLIALEGSLFSQQQVISTAERLQYVAAVAERLARQGVPHTTVEGLRDIAAAFSRRAEALRPPPLPAVTSATVAADMVAPARVDQPAAPLAHPPAPPTPPRVPSPPAAAREPFDWASFWSALFSERSLTALLGFGVLLVTVSSLVLLVSVWQTAEGGWEGAWPVVQPLLLGQFFLFLLSGYVIKERMKLHLSGLAVITIAALWVPLNLGAWMFKLFGPQVNQAREAAGGQYLAVPGIGVPLDLPLYAWLIVVLVSAVVWGALTYRFRGHLLAHGTVGFGGAGVALFVALFGMQLKWPLAFGWEWPLASLGALTVPLLLGWRRLRSASFGNIVEPMFWTAQGTLAGVLAVLGALVLTGRASGYPLAAVLASGTGLYLLAHRYARATAYQYAVVAFSVAALLSLAGEIELWKEPYFDALLMLAGLSYLAFGQWRRDPAESMAPRMIGLPLAPSYAAAYALLAAAVVWPPAFGNALHAAVLYGAAGVAFISARWWRHTAWTYLANLLFAAALAATLDLASPAPLPISGWAVAWGALAWVCLAQGRILRGVPGHSPAGFVCAMAASTGSLLWLVIFPDSTTALIALPMTAALFAALAFLVHQGREPALAGMVGRAVQALEGTSKGDSNARGAAAFMGVSIALAATWGAALVEHLSLSQVFHAYSLLFWACASASASRFRWGNGVYRKVFQGTGAVLGLFSVAMSLSAYESQAASSSGAGQVLPALYGAAALALAFRFLTANPTSLYVAAGFLPVPVALTLQWLGLPGHLWAAPFMALASAYLAPGVFRVLGLQATDARALRQTGIGVSALALAWTLYWMVSVWADRDPGTPGVAERVLAGAAPLAASLWAAVLAYQQRAISWGYA
ncbi:MAG: hypothetical protein HY681_14280, partial [Chloroflexi bacterium]|nr:hypothetical protein [Chloroflexota bacterium]